MNSKRIDNIFTSQKRFFQRGKTLNYDFRKKMLLKLKSEILNKEPDISAALNKDLGKSLGESLTTEIGVVINEINYALKHLKSWMSIEKKKNNFINIFSKSYIIKEPFGTVLIISPWNYPFQLTISPLIGAIAAGNCAVIKPSEISPNVSCVIDEIISKVFSKNFISVIQGDATTADYLLGLNFDMIFFTGSPKIGKIVMKKASEHLIPLVLELGGKSPCIIHKSADIKTAAKKIAFGKTLNAGQTCVAPDYVLIPRKFKNEFVYEYASAVEDFYGKDYSNDYGKIINEKNFHRIINYLDDGNILFGGTYQSESLFIEPTLIEVDELDSPIMKDEIFGPVLPVIFYSNIKDIKSIVDLNPNPLSLYIFSNDRCFTKNILTTIPSGGCCVNDTIMHLTNENLPFGGRGKSGMGSYHGKYSFDAFTHNKSVLERSNTLEFKEKYPPYTDMKLDLIKKIFGLKKAPRK